ncbi:MAG: glycosyltransferase family 2 protein, partial [Candidatus Melainabacteria bacterium]|nr:glycosyltransferase family 2 protein [Candidatus Melainabacteria bacterium]
MSKEEKKQKNTTDMPLLSAAIITFNEERIIEKTLSAIDNWVDEIIVVDSYSTDNTLNILDMFNVKLIQRKWEGYSKQKNYVISQCTGDWILVLDADEIVTEPLKAEISKVIKKPDKKCGYK